MALVRAGWVDAKFVLFTRDAPEAARAVLRDQLYRLTTIMRGTLAYSRNRAIEPMGTWWSGDTPIPISFWNVVQSLRCLRLCTWEPPGIAPPIDPDPDPTEEGGRSRVAGRATPFLLASPAGWPNSGVSTGFRHARSPTHLSSSTSTRHWGPPCSRTRSRREAQWASTASTIPQ